MIKLFTHTDLDGVGCAVLAKLAFGDKTVDIEYCNYDDIDLKVEEYLNSKKRYECHITDISINEELASKINKSKKKFQLLDHHPTAEGLNVFDWCKVQIEDKETNLKTCGTEMYYNYLIAERHLSKEDTLDKFVKLVRDYDTWRWKSLKEEGTICKQINDLLYLYGRDKFIEWCISELNDGVFPKLYESDKLVLDVKQKEIDDYINHKDKQLFVGDFGSKRCGFVFAEKYASELGNKLCEMHSELDFVAIINMDGTISYRTIRDDIDLGKEVAVAFGGGGHPKAAGSRFSKEVQMEVIKKIFG